MTDELKGIREAWDYLNSITMQHNGDCYCDFCQHDDYAKIIEVRTKLFLILEENGQA